MLKVCLPLSNVSFERANLKELVFTNVTVFPSNDVCFATLVSSQVITIY